MERVDTFIGNKSTEFEVAGVGKVSSYNDTLPKMLLQLYQRCPEKVAMRKKRLGIWQEYTWEDYYLAVKYLSLGLINLGLKRGDSLAIIGDNDPQWFWSNLAVMAAGGVAVGLYVDAMAEELIYLLNHSDSKFVIVKDQEQVDKILKIKDALPLLTKVIYWESKGLAGYTDPLLMSFAQVLERGKECKEQNVFEQNVEQGIGSDVCLLSYTSGTTALPKGEIISHYNLIFSAMGMVFFDAWKDTDNYLSYISPAWLTEQVLGITGSLLSAGVVNFPEEPETIQQNMREIAPNFVLFIPNLWESLISQTLAKVNDAGAIKKGFFNLAMRIGYRVADTHITKGEPVKNPVWKFLYALSYIMVFRPLRDKLGLLKARCAITGGAIMSPDMLRFFHAIGVPLKQHYTLTEAGPAIEHSNDDIKFETVGRPLPGVQIRINEDNEILLRTATVMLGYYKDEELTHKKIGKNGWLHTGDAGYVGEDTHLICWGRADELSELAGGTKYAPGYIESRLRFSAYIKDAMIIGGGEHPYPIGIIIIDFTNVGRWAEKNGITYTTVADLSQREQVGKLVLSDIMNVNRTLPEEARIARFAILHKEFDPDEAELTRSRKLRRGFIESRYNGLISAMYEAKSEFTVETEVKYADGTVAMTRVLLKIQNVGDHDQ